MPTLLLFDVDGVLVQPDGYKIALRDTVNYFARRMAQADVDLTFEEIAVFEACGLTNEWDSAAMCVGAMLVEALLIAPQAYRPSFNTTLNTILTTGIRVPRPDFVGLAHTIAERNVYHQAVTRFSHQVLREMLPIEQQPILIPLFEDIFGLDTPTTRIQQTHTLGHQRYFETYGVSAPFEGDSYLIEYDRPLLSRVNHEQLMTWRRRGERDFCIFTARPSLPPTGEALGYAPEADLAAELLGMRGYVPIIGAGRLQWLAARHGRTTADYIKPYPTQAVAAIGAALSQQEQPSLEAAAALTEQDRLQYPLSMLVNRKTEIVVFEDSVGGIVAAKQAADQLQSHGLDLKFRAVGVSPDAAKRDALATVAEVVVNDVNDGLALIWGN